MCQGHFYPFLSEPGNPFRILILTPSPGLGCDSQIQNLLLTCTLMNKLEDGGLKALITSGSIILLFSFLKDHYNLKTNFILLQVKDRLSP